MRALHETRRVFVGLWAVTRGLASAAVGLVLRELRDRLLGAARHGLRGLQSRPKRMNRTDWAFGVVLCLASTWGCRA